MPIYPMPFCRVEIALQSLFEGRLCTLLIQRQEEPYKGFWGLPGGVLRVDLDADLDATARRVSGERLGLVPPSLKQLVAVGAKGRDPRGEKEWGLSVVYYALVPEGSVSPAAGKRVSALKWVPADGKPPRMAFDHPSLIAQVVQATRSAVADLNYPEGFVPERFTLSQLQGLSEQVLGRGLDKSSFRRKLRERGLVQAIDGEFTTGEKSRPAALYRLRAA